MVSSIVSYQIMYRHDVMVKVVTHTKQQSTKTRDVMVANIHEFLTSKLNTGCDLCAVAALSAVSIG